MRRLSCECVILAVGSLAMMGVGGCVASDSKHSESELSVISRQVAMNMPSDENSTRMVEFLCERPTGAESLVFLVHHGLCFNTFSFTRLYVADGVLVGESRYWDESDRDGWQTQFRRPEANHRTTFAAFATILRDSGTKGVPTQFLYGDFTWVVSAETGRWALLDRISDLDGNTYDLSESFMNALYYFDPNQDDGYPPEPERRANAIREAQDASTLLDRANANEMSPSAMAARTLQRLVEWWRLIEVQRRATSAGFETFQEPERRDDHHEPVAIGAFLLDAVDDGLLKPISDAKVNVERPEVAVRTCGSNGVSHRIEAWRDAEEGAVMRVDGGTVLYRITRMHMDELARLNAKGTSSR